MGRGGRPRSDLSRQVVQHLVQAGPLTARELAHQLKLSIPVACNALHRLESRGELVLKSWVRAGHAKRPVAVYEAPDQPAHSAPWVILQRWPR